MHATIWMSATLALMTAGEFTIERIFGPEVPGRYKHPAALEELANGDLYLVYYGGSGEYADDTAVYGSRLAKGATHWSPPKPIATSQRKGVGNAVVWQAPDGVVWLFYVTRTGDTWSSSMITAQTSTDGAKSWSKPFDLATERGMMVRNRPIVLSDGDYLLPAYHETGENREWVGPDTTSLFLRYEVKAKRWVPSSRIRSRQGNLQPAVVEFKPGHLVCYCRRGGGYGPTTDGYIVRAESRDGGRTWSEGKDTDFPNPNAAVDFLKLQSGNLLLVYNDSMVERTPLTVALSTDGDKSYPHRKNVATGPNAYAYPYVIQTKDGKIHLIFTSNRRTIINRVVFEEKDILQK